MESRQKAHLRHSWMWILLLELIFLQNTVLNIVYLYVVWNKCWCLWFGVNRCWCCIRKSSRLSLWAKKKVVLLQQTLRLWYRIFLFKAEICATKAFERNPMIVTVRLSNKRKHLKIICDYLFPGPTEYCIFFIISTKLILFSTEVKLA